MTENDNHERWTELLGPHLEGRLDAVKAAALTEHLEGCPECRRELAGLRLLQAREPAGLRRGERKALHRAIEAEMAAGRKTAGAPVPWFARLAPAMGAAALVVMIVAGGILLTTNGADDSGGDAETVTQPFSDDAGAGGGLRDSDEATEEAQGDGAKRTKKGSRAAASLEAQTDDGDRTEGKKQRTFASATGSGGNDTGQTTNSGSGDKAADKGSDNDGSESQPDPQPSDEEHPPSGSPARTPAEVSIEPSSGGGTVGGCSAFTITVGDEQGDPFDGVVVDVEQSHELADDDIDANEPVVSFCLPGSGPNASDVDETAGDLDPDEEQPDNPGTSGGETFATTNSKGRVTIGLAVQPANGSDGSGMVSLVAFIDTGGDDDDVGGEDPVGYATQQWSAPEESRSRALPWWIRTRSRAGAIFR